MLLAQKNIVLLSLIFGWNQDRLTATITVDTKDGFVHDRNQGLRDTKEALQDNLFAMTFSGCVRYALKAYTLSTQEQHVCLPGPITKRFLVLFL
ncbi:hypothetical protein KM043_012857 [Ampulex compressa]|nr:hypothetical protein KM043_012857 [Ampulex compressa]